MLFHANATMFFIYFRFVLFSRNKEKKDNRFLFLISQTINKVHKKYEKRQNPNETTTIE